MNMYLWDTNILRAFIQGHPTLQLHFKRIPWSQIALPSVVIAEAIQGRCEAALKATPVDAPVAHQRLFETQQMLARFHAVVFDTTCVEIMERLCQQHRRSKRYADLMIAAIALAGRHVVVTRNQKDFVDLLPKTQLTNWIDRPP